MAKRSFLDSPNLPILALGGAGLFLLSRSGFFKGVGEVGEGIGDAVSGGGSFLRETFIQGGETIRQGGETVRELFSQGEGIISSTGGSLRRGIDLTSDISGNLLGTGVNLTSVPFKLSEFFAGNVETGLDRASSVLRGGSSLISDAVSKLPSPTPSSNNLVIGGISQAVASATNFLRADKTSSQGEISLPSGSGGGSFTPAPQNFTPVPTTEEKSPSIRNKIIETVTKPAKTAKGLLSSGISKLRSFF